MNLVQRAARLLDGTPLYRPAVRSYNGFQHLVDDSPLSAVLDYYFVGRRLPFVPVKPKGRDFPRYVVGLEPTGRQQRNRARGVYEPHVMSFLDERLTPDSVFWEIGAAWGYFSLAAATRVAEVYAFEMMTERAEKLEAAVRENRFDNVTVVTEKLDGDTDTYAYTDPDIVLVDIEGWEYTVLSDLLPKHADVTTWIVEVHADLVGVETDDPETHVRDLFEKAGYETWRLNEWSGHNVHIVADQP